MNKLALTIPDYTINAPAGIPETSHSNKAIEKIIEWGVTTLLVISTILAIFFLIYGGIKWITSGGDQKAVESARKTVTYAIIGLCVIFASFMILNFISAIFRVHYLPYTPGPIPAP